MSIRSDLRAIRSLIEELVERSRPSILHVNQARLDRGERREESVDNTKNDVLVGRLFEMVYERLGEHPARTVGGQQFGSFAHRSSQHVSPGSVHDSSPCSQCGAPSVGGAGRRAGHVARPSTDRPTGGAS